MPITPDVDALLVRHGETEWSAAGRHTSVSDLALTSAGEDQARALVPRLAEVRIALVLTSPRRRARDTCALAGLGAHARVDDDLAEWNYGSYEGLTTDQIRADDPDWTIFSAGAPRGESPQEVAARADRVLARVRAVDGLVALFSHGHFLRVLGARWIGQPVAAGAWLGLDPATVSCLGHERDQPVLRAWNA